MRLPEGLGVDIVSEHVKIGSDGALYMLGSHVKGRPVYHIVRVPPSGDGRLFVIAIMNQKFAIFATLGS